MIYVFIALAVITVGLCITALVRPFIAKLKQQEKELQQKILVLERLSSMQSKSINSLEKGFTLLHNVAEHHQLKFGELFARLNNRTKVKA